MSNREINLGSDRVILITGITAWLVLAFAVVKLSVLYSENPQIAYVIAYNIASLIYLIYFIGYFKERFGLKYLVLLLLVYNAGFHALQWLYNELFLIYTPTFEYVRFLAALSINAPLLITAWAAIYIFLKRRN